MSGSLQDGDIDTVWREWSACDFRDAEYLDYLFELLADHQAGESGRRLMGLAFLIWTPLVCWPIVLLTGVAAIDLGGQKLLPVTITGVALLAGGTLYATVTGSRWAEDARRRSVVRLLGILLATVGHVGSAFTVAPACDAELGEAFLRTLGIYGVAIVITTGVACGLLLVDGTGAIPPWTAYALAIPVSLLPLVLLAVCLLDSENRLGLRPPAQSVRKLCCRQPRPNFRELEQAVLSLSPGRGTCPFSELADETVQLDRLNEWTQGMTASDWRRRCISRHMCLRYEALAVDHLHQLEIDDLNHHAMIESTLRTICESTKRLRSRRFYCASCYAKVARHRAGPWRYRGCRVCRRSHDLVDYRTCVAAVLDSRLEGEYSLVGGKLCIHWTGLEEGCDFDQVELVHATDEMIERLAMSVHNEGDRYRRRLARKATCYVSAECQLFDNSRRLLERTFAKVQNVGDSVHGRTAVA